MLESLKGRDVGITFHKGGDIDAVSSAWVLSQFLDAELFMPDELDAEATIFAQKIGIKFSERRDYEYIVVVDSHSPNLLDVESAYLIIDHHMLMNRSIPATHSFIDPEAKATAEILALTLPTLKKEWALALGAGIVSDTARFKTAGPRTFKAFHKMMEIAQSPYEIILRLAYPHLEKRMRAEMLHKIQSARIEEADVYLIGVVKNEGNHGILANALVDAGCDIGVAYGEHKLSLRGGIWNPLHLGEVVARLVPGRGGGHYGAAGMFYDNEGEVNKLIRALKEKLKNIGQETQ